MTAGTALYHGTPAGEIMLVYERRETRCMCNRRQIRLIHAAVSPVIQEIKKNILKIGLLF
jgi:hypothetical protein